jgi:thymidylate kinase
LIIALEGLDACGKAYQAAAIAAVLQPSTIISFPRYSGPFGPPILAHLKEEVVFCQRDKESGVLSQSPDDAVVFQSLMTMDKYDAASEIKALDRKGQYVVLDRYWPSACCYGADDGLDFGSMLRINSCLPAADIYFLLDISVEESAKRRPTSRDRYERDKEKLARVRDRYLYMWHLMTEAHTTPKTRWIVLNGHSDAQEITNKILSEIKDTVAWYARLQACTLK